MPSQSPSVQRSNGAADDRRTKNSPGHSQQHESHHRTSVKRAQSGGGSEGQQKPAHSDNSKSPSLKRKSLSGHEDTGNQDGAAPSSQRKQQKKRQKVAHACLYCRRSHMTCDLERPCKRCVKRNIAHLCHDTVPPSKASNQETHPPMPPGRNGIWPGADAGGSVVPQGLPMNENGASAQLEMSAGQQLDNQSSKNGSMLGAGADANQASADTLGAGISKPLLPKPSPQFQSEPGSSAQQQQRNSEWSNIDAMRNQFQDMHHLHPNYMFNNAEITNEYNLLNDFLSTSLLDEGAMYNTDDAQTLLNDPLLSTSSMTLLSSNFQGMIDQSPEMQRQHPQHTYQPLTSLQTGSATPSAVPRPGSKTSSGPRPPGATPSAKSKDRGSTAAEQQSRNLFYMMAADPDGSSSTEDRLHALLQAKYDAGMLKPFNYVRGYARLNSYMTTHLSRQSVVRILQQLDRFRPKFREAMQGLSDIQLVLVEMWFERSLLEYDRVFAAMAIPACCWRRTGEIFRGNREMAELIGVHREELKDGKMAIHEIFAEESLVSYWEKFGAIAFDQSQKAVLTSCTLRWMKDDGDEATATSNVNDQGRRGGGAKDGKSVGASTSRREGSHRDSSISASSQQKSDRKNSESNHADKGNEAGGIDKNSNNANPDASNDNSANASSSKKAGKSPEQKGTSAGTGAAGGGGGSGGSIDANKPNLHEKRQLIKCCFSFTIRRDSHNIPSLIVGNFIPVKD